MKLLATKVFISAALMLAELMFVKVSPALALTMLFLAGLYLLWCGRSIESRDHSTEKEGPLRPGRVREPRRKTGSFFRRKWRGALSTDYSLKPVLRWLHDHGIKATRTRVMGSEKLEMMRGVVAAFHLAAVVDGARPDPELLWGPHHVIAWGPRGKVSIVFGGMTGGQYEIYCLEGGLFEDVRRYTTVEEVGHTVMSLVEKGLFYYTEDR